MVSENMCCYRQLRLFAKLPDDHRKEQLEKLMLEWNADIAYVYPKFLDVQRLGPNAALSEAWLMFGIRCTRLF